MVVLATMSALLGGSPARAGGAGLLYEVNSLADTVASNGECTLREAITSSNGTTTDCGPGSSGADGIVFAVDGTIVAASRLPTIVGEVAVDGAGHSIVITDDITSLDPSGLVSVDAGASLLLRNVTVDNADKTFGLFNHGTARISRVTFSDSLKPIQNEGTLTVAQSRFAGNGNATGGLGGAIANFGVLTITSSTFTDNFVLGGGGEGGAIYSAGTLTIDRSTFARNQADRGGAIYSNEGGVALTNSTLSGNGASLQGGAIFQSCCDLIITNSTLARNTASEGTALVIANGIATLSDSIVLGGIGASCRIGIGIVVTNGGGNIKWPDRSCPGTHADPKLDSQLRDNGGRTKTIALGWGSPAIDRGDPTCSAAPVNGRDQRGGTRPVDGDVDGSARCDSGAFEYGALKAPAPVLVSNTNVSGGESLTWARARDALRYVVQVRMGGSLVATRTTTGTGVIIALGRGTFTWTVQACNGLGCTRSAPRTFTR